MMGLNGKVSNYLPYVKDGKLCRCDGVVIERPALFMDVGADTLLKWGEYDSVKRYSDSWKGVFDVLGCKGKMLTLSKVDVKDACYIIQRSMLYTLSGFLVKVAEKWGTEGFKDWLEEEKKRIPLELENKS